MRTERHDFLKRNKKGFTLAELLIVVAIIAVLVAISIPIFTSQLEKAREATDAANIRSQYAEVMSEAITSGGDVNGKDMYGAVQLKQKKDGWQTSNLKENLKGMYAEVKGGGPKAGGTAWVEYISSSESVILHYDGGSSSGSGSGSGSDSGSGSGGTDSGSTSGGGSSGTGGNTGGGVIVSPGDNTTIGQLDTQAKQWPETINEDINIKQGDVYSYQGKYYVALTDHLVNAQSSEHPGNETWYLRQVNTDAKVLNSSDLLQKNDGTFYLDNLQVGQLYVKDDTTVWIRTYAPGIGVEPPDGSNWQILNGVNIQK